MDTSALIRQLAADSRPFQPLAQPWARTMRWVAWSLIPLLAVAVLWPHPAISTALDVRFFVAQAAALATGIIAAAAAFASVVPGYSRRGAFLVLIPLAIWLSVLGHACVLDWSTTAQWGAILRLHWACVPDTLLAGALPAVALIVMLRKGAPMTPSLTTALAGVAGAGLANVVMRVVHASDASLVVLVWHVLAVFAASAASALLGRWIFTWRRAQARHGLGR